MSIRRVETWTVRFPLARPVVFETMRIVERDYAIVRLTDDSGARGFAYGLARNAPIAAAVARMAPLVLGADPRLSERLWSTLYESSITHGQRGVSLRALSLFDIALWDLRGRLAGMPVHALLGGYRTEIPVGVAGGYYRDVRPADEIAAELAEYAQQGFALVKIVAGGWSPRREEAWMAAARDAVGADVDLAVDTHWTWRDVGGARAVLERFDPFRLAWIEDPLWPEAVQAMAALRRLIRTPLAVGDEQSGRWAYQNLLAAEAADVWRVDLTVVGGFTEFRRIAGIAATWGIPISTHVYPELHVHCAAAEAVVVPLEYVAPEADIELSFRFITQPLVPANGWVQAPTTPGLGFDLDWALIVGSASEEFVVSS